MTHHNQIGGDHYDNGLPEQWIDLMSVYQLPASEATAIKYVLRHRRKKGLQDLFKAMDYTKNLIHHFGGSAVANTNEMHIPQNRNYEVVLNYLKRVDALGREDHHITADEQGFCLLIIQGYYEKALEALCDIVKNAYSDHSAFEGLNVLNQAAIEGVFKIAKNQ